MTPEELIRLFGYPAVPFGGTPEPQPIPQPPVNPQPPDQTMPQYPSVDTSNAQPMANLPVQLTGQGQTGNQQVNIRDLAVQQALKMLNQPDEKQKPWMPLGMALMGIGQQMQTPPGLRGRTDNLSNMAQNLLMWQLKNSQNQETANYRRAMALKALSGLVEPGELSPKVVGGAIYTPGKGFEYPELSAADKARQEMKTQEQQARLDQLATQYGYNEALKILGHENAMKQIQERANLANKEKQYAPQLVEMDDGRMGVLNVNTGDIRPVSGAVGKAKAGGEDATRGKVINQLNTMGISPSDPDYEATFDRLYNVMKGKKTPLPDVVGALNPSLKGKETGEIRMYKGRRYKVIMQNGVPGIDTNNPLD